MGEDPEAELIESRRARAQLDVARAEVERLRAELRETLGEWLALDEALPQADTAAQLRHVESELARLRASRPYRLTQRLLQPARGARDLLRRARYRIAGPPALDPPQTPRGFDKYQRQGAYHWRYYAKHAWYRHRVQAVCELARPGESAIDLGCGDGVLVNALARRGCRAVGVERDPLAIELAEAEISRRGTQGARLVAGDLRELDPRELGAPFDLVTSLDCIEHLDDPGAFLDLARGLLRPGGRVVIGTPLWIGSEFLSDYHVREFTYAQLQGLFLPRFARVADRYLLAPVPGRKQLKPRFYLFVGRRRRL